MKDSNDLVAEKHLNNRRACASWKERRVKGCKTENRARTSGSESCEGIYLMRCHVRRMSGTGDVWVAACEGEVSAWQLQAWLGTRVVEMWSGWWCQSQGWMDGLLASKSIGMLARAANTGQRLRTIGKPLGWDC